MLKQDFEQRCRERGVPVTWQRSAVYEALWAREDHPTADDLYEELAPKLPGLSRATVYRVLETLVGLGLASRVAHPGAAARFDAETGNHHHLLCSSCGRLIDLEAVLPIPVPSALPEAFDIQDASVYFRGTCALCRETREPDPRSTSKRR
jgi:Fur family transcriptional regulator, peroxide stress response regulator